jgi:hypothetical protein
MARQVLPIAGAIVGAFFGSPQIGYAIGSIIGNAVDPQVIKGPALGEGQVNTAREGGYRPIVLGTGCVGCNIINVGPEIIRTHRDRQSKGGGPVSETKRRYRTFALRICEGPVAGLLRIWQGEKLVYDVRPESVISGESVEYAEGFTFYKGDEDQLPDPDLEAFLGVGNVNAYRGTSYIVFKHFDLTDTQGAIPNFRFEVASATDLTGYSYATIVTSPGHIMTSPTGVNWGGDIDTGLGAEIVMIKALGNAVFVFAEDGSGRVSFDRGDSWQDVIGTEDNTGEGAYPYLMDEDSGAFVIAYTSGDYVYRSSNGINFTRVDHGVLRSWYGLAGKGGVWVLTGTLGYAMISINGGLSFDEQPIFATTIEALTKNDTHFIGYSSGQIVFSSSGAPGTWNANSFPGSIFLKHYVSALGARVLLTAGENAYYTDNLGLSWTSGGTFSSGISGSAPDNNIVHNGIRFIIGLDEATIDISDTGSAWNQTFNGPGIGTTLVAAQPGISGAGQATVLSSIVSFVHLRCGHSASQYDISELTDPVDGIVFADGYTGADAIKTLLPIYFADASEHDAGSGYKINYIKRGKPVVSTITIDDLVDEPDEAIRQDSLERPAKLHLHFQNPTIGYAAAKATSARSSPDVLVTGEVSVQVPITFADVDEAWKISNKLHKVAWVEVAGTQELMLSDKDLDLVPTDCIGLSLRGIVTRYRMVSQEYVDGTIKCEFLADRQSAYTSNVTGIPLPDPEPPPPSIVGPTISVFGDWPALVDSHDALIAYVAATGQTSAWWGAVYQRSLDAGANYTTAATFDDFNSIMGTLQGDLPDASPHYTDTTNVVRVRLYTEETIDSLSQQQFLSEGGAFALSWEDSGATRWEILQYRDAEQGSNGDWLLSTLLRGRLNTETAEHLTGATLVMLDNSLKVMAMQSAWLGMDLTHRAISNGETPEDAVPYTDEFTGQSQTEWPVANLLLDRDGDDIIATAVPRHRFGTDDAPVQSINHDGYRWTATAGASSATADTDAPTHTFDATGWSSPVTVTVAQLNRYTGAGPAVSEEIA